MSFLTDPDLIKFLIKLGYMDANGSIRMPLGASGSFGGVCGIVDSQFSAAGVANGADTTDDTLFTIRALAVQNPNILPALLLDVNNKMIRVTMRGTSGATANNKRVKIKFGATTVLDSGVVTINNKTWEAYVEIFRQSANAQRAYGWFTSDGVAPIATRTSPAENLAAGVTLIGTGASPTTGAAADITGETFEVELVNLS